MKKNYFCLAFAMMLFAVKGYSQAPCATDEIYKLQKQQNPDVAAYEKQLNESIAAFIASAANPAKAAAKTSTDTHADTDYYDIPVVVHVIHNYGAELLKDSSIYGLIKDLNTFYNAQNNLSTIIPPFRKYIGNAKMRFHLATKDPMGNPTTGITHRVSYLTYGGDDQAKFDQWPPHNYYNIWCENVIGRPTPGGTVLAYSTLPPGAESFPYNDGVITRADRINDGNTIQHESGHFFNLLHLWNSGTGVGEVCGDDEVDDTPPTKGHFSVCGATQLYDTTCATNYYKLYVGASGMSDSLVNYPDTTNTQNVMDYSDCPQNMLSKGQVWRMRATLNSPIGGRNNLWADENLAVTGALTSVDLAPVTDFVTRQTIIATSPISFFTFPGTNLFFNNKSWRDTITKVEWTFSNGAAKPTASFTTYSGINSGFDNNFAEPGWVNIKLEATGNNTGVTSTTYDHSVFVADKTGVNGAGYMQEFNADGDRDKWPTFNYYNNNFKWKLADVGVFDNSCIMYQGFDERTGTDLLTGSPRGDYDDLYSVPFDLSSYAGSGLCNLNFHFSSASRTGSPDHVTDTMVIDYSTNKTHVWVNLTTLGKGNLINKGASSTAYTPTSYADWSPMTIAIPNAARSPYTVFRFRYKPGVFKGATQGSTGNNFYMDRIHVSAWPADVANVKMGDIDVRVVPNPTNGDAYVVVKDIANSKVEIAVSDITGKVVYRTHEQLSGNAARVQIPHQVIATQGIYLVQTITGNQTNTQKLVVY